MGPSPESPRPRSLSMAEVIARGGISGGDGTDPPADPPAPLEVLDRDAVEQLEPEQLRTLVAAAEAEIAALTEAGLAGLAARNRRNDLYAFRNVLAETLNAIAAADAAPPTVVDIDPAPPADDDAADPPVAEDTDPPAIDPVDDSDVGDPVIEGDPPTVTAEDRVPVAMTAAPLLAAPTTEHAGAALDRDGLFSEIKEIWDHPGKARGTIGRYDQVDPDTPRLTDSASHNAEILGLQREDRLARLASICETPDIRREIPDCGDLAEPVRALFGQFPSDNMTIEYHTEEPLSNVATGVGTWTPSDRTAYDLAVTNGDADAILAAQKVCYLVDCNAATLATALPVYACVEHTLETQYSHPQVIASVENRVRRRLARVKEQVLLDFVRAEAFHFDVDASLFGIGLGGVTSILEAVKSVMGSVVVEERIEEGNYTAIVPWGFPGLFDLDGATACNKGMVDLTDFGVTGITETKDNFTGAADPFPSLVSDLYPDWDPASRGPSNSENLVPFPADNWWIGLVDPSSWFYFSPFEFTLGATREDGHVKGNKTRSLFIEGAHGLARNGCQPAIWLNFSNVCAAGVRAACAEPTCVETS